MDLSIIIPCHNLESFIPHLLNSLSTQVFSYTVELIFILDNCTDNTLEVINKYTYDLLKKFNDCIIKEVNVKNAGMARNEGLEIASGTYIWFIDGDDWLISNSAIDTLIYCMNETDEDIIQFQYESPPFFRFRGHPSMPWQYVFKHEIIKDERFPNIQPHEDFEFIKALYRKGYRPYQIEATLYHYNYLREGSNMRQFMEKGRIDQ